MPSVHNTSNSAEYQSALKQVRELRSFYSHLATYVMVILVLFFINIITSPDILWFQWPAFFWGIALFIHGFNFFVFRKMMNPYWEEREVQKILNKQ